MTTTKAPKTELNTQESKTSTITTETQKENKTMDQVTEETINEALQAFEDPYVFEKPIKRVAVIGAGPAGLVAGKALKDKGFDVHIYDRGAKVGGNWVYNNKKVEKPFIPITKEDEQFWKKDETEPLPEYVNSTEPIEITPEVENWLLSKHHPPSACYEYLVNNTLTPVLRSLDYPWPANTPDIVPHTCIQQYYENFVEHFDLLKHIHFYTSLNHLEKNENGWELSLVQATYLDDDKKKKVKFNKYKESFDAVVLATGEFHTPFVPYYDGLHEFNNRFPGRIEHSKQFVQPEILEKKKILIVGGNVSSVDILNMLTVVDCEVYLSIRGPLITNVFIIDLIRKLIPENTIIKPAVECFYSKNQDDDNEKLVDGTVRFTDGTEINDFDHIIFATGYLAPLSYLGSLRRTTVINNNNNKENDQQQENVNNNNNNNNRDDDDDDDDSLYVMTNSKKILNTYKDIFLINDPTLTFVGTTKHLSTVLFFDYQAKAIAHVWSQQALLPSKKLMKKFNETFEPPCHLASFEGEHERMRVENLVPWLNTHAEKLNLNLPPIESLPEFVVEVNQRGFDHISKNGARFVKIVEERKKKKELEEKLNAN